MNNRSKIIISSTITLIILGGIIVVPHIVALVSLGVLCVGLVLFVWWLIFILLDELTK